MARVRFTYVTFVCKGKFPAEGARGHRCGAANSVCRRRNSTKFERPGEHSMGRSANDARHSGDRLLLSPLRSGQATSTPRAEGFCAPDVAVVSGQGRLPGQADAQDQQGPTCMRDADGQGARRRLPEHPAQPGQLTARPSREEARPSNGPSCSPPARPLWPPSWSPAPAPHLARRVPRLTSRDARLSTSIVRYREGAGRGALERRPSFELTSRGQEFRHVGHPGSCLRSHSA